MYLARLKGADAVLLIAAILSDKDLRYFVQIAPCPRDERAGGGSH